MCFSPQRRAIFQHLNFKKWSEHVSFLAFSVENALLATAACNFRIGDFSNIWRGCIFFLLTFALLHLLSSDSTSSSDFTFFWLYFIYLLFICFSTLHIVGSLLFKLPSINEDEDGRLNQGYQSILCLSSLSRFIFFLANDKCQDNRKYRHGWITLWWARWR